MEPPINNLPPATSSDAMDYLIKLVEKSPSAKRALAEKLDIQGYDARYYCEQHAAPLREVFDQMLNDPEQLPRDILADDYPQWSLNTIKQKLTDGRRWIVDNDKEGKYKRFESGTFEIQKLSQGKGFRLLFINQDTSKAVWKAHKVKPMSDEKIDVIQHVEFTEQWKDKCIQAVEELQDNQQAKINNLSMKFPQDFEAVKNFFEDLPDFIVRVGPNYIKIIKTQIEGTDRILWMD